MLTKSGLNGVLLQRVIRASGLVTGCPTRLHLFHATERAGIAMPHNWRLEKYTILFHILLVNVGGTNIAPY